MLTYCVEKRTIYFKTVSPDGIIFNGLTEMVRIDFIFVLPFDEGGRGFPIS